jgi:hypothetical protein
MARGYCVGEETVASSDATMPFASTTLESIPSEARGTWRPRAEIAGDMAGSAPVATPSLCGAFAGPPPGAVGLAAVLQTTLPDVSSLQSAPIQADNPVNHLDARRTRRDP